MNLDGLEESRGLRKAKQTRHRFRSCSWTASGLSLTLLLGSLFFLSLKPSSGGSKFGHSAEHLLLHKPLKVERQLTEEKGPESTGLNATIHWTNDRIRLFQRQREGFRPGEPWLDEDGHLIQAHGGGVMYHEGVYYWFGEHKGGQTYERETKAYHPPRVDVIGVSCYSSTDLLHWKNEGLALKADTHSDLQPHNVLERPKVIYHRATGSFVMWMHVDTEDYEWAHVGVAVSDTVTGPYTFLRSWRPHNQHARDLTVFQDDDERAYIAYSSEDNSVMHLAELTHDYLEIRKSYKRILVGRKREAPAMFKFRQYYLLLTSGCTGWDPNRPELFYTEDIMGEWESLGNPFAGGHEHQRSYAFFSQPTSVVKVQHTKGSYIVLMDQWDTENLGASRYAWLPLFLEEWAPEVVDRARDWWSEDREAKKSQTNYFGYWFTVRPAPIHAVVLWSKFWRPSILDHPLDAKIRTEHYHELLTYPEREDGTFDYGQDALYGHRFKP